MQHKQVIIFDFDGTLVDSGEAILASWRHAMQSLGLPEPAGWEVEVRGPALRDSWRKLFGMTCDVEIERAVAAYREHMSDNYDIIQTYDGIRELLDVLQSQGKTLLVATARSQYTCEIILKLLDLAKYFTAVSGDVPEGGQADKSLNIGRAMAYAGVNDAESCVMVGDKDIDILGAAAHTMDSIGVTYGYGKPGELDEATLIVDSVKQLHKTLVGDTA